MRVPVTSLELVRLASLHEALALMREGGLVPLAGCTDLYVLLNAGITPGRRFVDLWALDELRGIDVEQDVVRLGALSTYRELMAAPAVVSHLPMLVEASRVVGAVQIHNRGTLGGNIANGSPAGDTLPVLAALDATVVLASVDGERRVPFTSFYTGYRRSVRRDDELIARIEVPIRPGRQWFRKVGTRAAQAISKVVMAAVRSDPPRIALGSVAPTVVRAWATERALAAGATLAEARRVLSGEIHPIDDIRSTAAYRRRVAGNLLERFWRDTEPAR
jgi:CO/xanthine dehydrogenase FAD-binding subunit